MFFQKLIKLISDYKLFVLLFSSCALNVLFITTTGAGSFLGKDYSKINWIKNKVINCKDADEVANYILDSSNRLLAGNYKLETCVLEIESNFSNVKSGDGGTAIGIGQMHPKAMVDSCHYLGIKDCKYSHLIKRVKNEKMFAIELSAGYLSMLKHYYHGNVTKAMIAYNVGIDKVNHGGWSWAYFDKIVSCGAVLKRKVSRK
jgi:hypothetical protein